MGIVTGSLAVVLAASVAVPTVQPWSGDETDAGPARVLDVEPQILDVVPRVEDVVVPTPQGESISVGSDVLFAFGSAELSPAATAQLAGVNARIASENPVAIRVEGHTDGIGDDAANQTLSAQRAAAVAAVLTAGVPCSSSGSGSPSRCFPRPCPARTTPRPGRGTAASPSSWTGPEMGHGLA